VFWDNRHQLQAMATRVAPSRGSLEDSALARIAMAGDGAAFAERSRS